MDVTAAYRSIGNSSLPREMWPSAAYTGVLTLIGRAERAISRGDVQAAHDALLRAQQIVHVLRESLRGEGTDLSRQLSALYAYIAGELARANLTKDAARLQSLAGVVAPLRDAWETAGRNALQTGAARVGGKG
jgi:flagellar protein FliS